MTQLKANLDPRQIFQANLEELREYEMIVGGLEAPTAYYVKVLLSDLKDDRTKLEDLVSKLKKLEAEKGVKDCQWRWVAQTAALRLQIRTGRIKKETQAAVEEVAKLVPLWTGEAYFVMGMSYEVMQYDGIAKDYFVQAYQEFMRLGLSRKAIRALHNAISADARVSSDKRFLHQWHSLYRKATEVGCDDVAGMALNSLSREYQLAGAPTLALRHINQAVELIRRDLFGSQTYYLAVCNRAHIYLDLDMKDLAIVDYEEARVSGLEEIKDAVEALQKIFKEAGMNVDTRFNAGGRKVKTWKNRSAKVYRWSVQRQYQLSDMETELVLLLSKSPHTKKQIIESVYSGSEEKPSTLENRFKQLMFRIRKKHPTLVTFAKGKYLIPKDSFEGGVSAQIDGEFEEAEQSA